MRDIKALSLSNHKVSNVKYMSSMFEYAKCENLDLSGWNTAALTDTSSMFGSSFIKHIYIGSNWTMDNVTNSDRMFFRCTNLPGYSASKTSGQYAKLTTDGGYFETKTVTP